MMTALKAIALASACVAIGACWRAHMAGPNLPQVGQTYRVSVKAPPSGKVGERLVASIRLEPRGRYQVDDDYPLALAVHGPTAASPQEATFGRAEAHRFTRKGVVFKPAFRLMAPGNHRFTASFRFGVCTTARCELKTVRLAWTVQVQ